jgi:DNA repair protein RadC
MIDLIDKLVARGAQALTDEELLAVILADASGDEPLNVVAELMHSAGGDIVSLAAADTARLRMVAGLGKVRAARLKGAIELGRRLAVAEASECEVVTSDGDVVRIMEPHIGRLQHEECWALYLASSGKVLERMRISQGGVQATVVDCRLIIKRALELLAVQIVLVHNHPSGSADPSSQDIALTERVAEAAKLFDIRLLDHVIVARGAHFSFRGHNMVK